MIIRCLAPAVFANKLSQTSLRIKYSFFVAAGQCLLIFILLLGLVACGGGQTADLQNYISEVKSRQKSHIPPLPKPQKFEVFTYDDAILRDPFVPIAVIQAAENSDSGLRPNMKRDRDVLEQYALGSLKMMGSMEKSGQRWALVRASDGTLFRTKKGRYLGQNNGEIVEVTESQLKLREIVPDGLGGWIERFSTLAVTE